MTIRCALCHDDAWTVAPTVCGACFAVHHEPCWRELGSCASCRATLALRAASEGPGPGRLVALGLVGPLTLVFAVVSPCLVASAFDGHGPDAGEQAAVVGGVAAALAFLVVLWSAAVAPRLATWVAGLPARALSSVLGASLAPTGHRTRRRAVREKA